MYFFVTKKTCRFSYFSIKLEPVLFQKISQHIWWKKYPEHVCSADRFHCLKRKLNPKREKKKKDEGRMKEECSTINEQMSADLSTQIIRWYA